MDLDMSMYVRLPHIIGDVLSTFRSSMGDFSMIDPY